MTTYYDEVIETMPRPALANLQEHLLLRLVPFVYECSGLVREHWDAVGLSTAAIRSLDDFRAKVPFLNKDMLRSYRDRTGDPFGGTRCEGQPRLRSVGFTSGTTGDPTAIPFSDQIASNRGLKRDLWHIGLRPGDYFIYNILTIRRGQESDRFADVGFRPICLGHGTNELGRLLEACEAFRPKVLHHLSRPLIAALEELDSLGKVDLKSVFASCVGAVFGGEPPGPKAVRLVRSWGFELFDFTSLGDVCSAMECRAHDGMHAWEDLAFVECIDPDSDEPEFPQQCQKALICNALANSPHQQPMMDGVEVAGQVTFNNPATRHARFITVLQLQLDRSYRMVDAAFGSEAVGKPMKIAFPNRLHRHQHRPLHDSITQTRYAQGPQFRLVTRFRNIHTACR